MKMLNREKIIKTLLVEYRHELEQLTDAELESHASTIKDIVEQLDDQEQNRNKRKQFDDFPS